MSEYVEFNIRPRLPSQEGHKVLDGRKYHVWIRYMKHEGNDSIGKWYMDLTQVADPTISIKGKALLPGRNLFRAHGYANILGELWVEDTAGTTDNPTYEGMGDRWRLRYYPLES